MPCGEYKAIDVSTENLGTVVGSYKLDNPLKIETTLQADGKWTVRAIFPPCAEGEEEGAKREVNFEEVKPHLALANIAHRLGGSV